MMLARFLADWPEAVLVCVAGLRGSGPREAGARMIVARGAVHGTIGGGHLEYMAIDRARAMLCGKAESPAMEVALGPESGQCCGGRVRLAFERLDEAGRARLVAAERAEQGAMPQVMIFGAGHVGRALARVLTLLPVRSEIVDTRTEELEQVDTAVAKRLVALPEAELRRAEPGAAIVIATHDHALDFLIAVEALRRPDLGYRGMIGSHTKRASFNGWLRRNDPDLDPGRLVCPMAAAQKHDKRPEVIAVQVAAEVMAALAAHESIRGSMEKAG